MKRPASSVLLLALPLAAALAGCASGGGNTTWTTLVDAKFRRLEFKAL